MSSFGGREREKMKYVVVHSLEIYKIIIQCDRISDAISECDGVFGEKGAIQNGFIMQFYAAEHKIAHSLLKQLTVFCHILIKCRGAGCVVCAINY